ncbi:M24 family metallopeptidase [Algisphaera agarilytica]|uniref:Xaa-Pro aminopeptidase n=1 Tax=Algisphaera agarilytica TaxID=1385975 RepID=A0A7X0H8N5_9BACT|nr:aminopeptidase P family protein [Algisphaera agarilytica]MBB6431092.1 Xaa-Pro aminopeptidase [Algisphaera agarilytica]
MSKSKPTETLDSRLRKLRGRLRDAGHDALLVTNPVDTRYLTGFVGDDSWTLVPAKRGQPIVLSDNRFEEQIKQEAPHVKAVMRKQSLADELAKLADRRNLQRIAVQCGHLTLAQYDAIGKKVGKRRLQAFEDGLLEQRAVKTDDEVRLIRKAGKIQQEAFIELLDFIEPGQRESEVAAFLEYRMRALGADGVSFPSIVAADANAALPHAIPGNRKLKKGGIVLIDWGAKYKGYCSDMTRVIGLGGMKPKMREIYQVCLESQLAGIDAIRPGVKLTDVDAAARKVIDDAGYGDFFGHGLGHGIGLDIHEAPRLSPLAGPGVLEPGHVVTVEPGIYLPGVGGVRIEDDVLVTARGKQVLTDLPKSLESAII